MRFLDSLCACFRCFGMLWFSLCAFLCSQWENIIDFCYCVGLVMFHVCTVCSYLCLNWDIMGYYRVSSLWLFWWPIFHSVPAFLFVLL